MSLLKQFFKRYLPSSLYQPFLFFFRTHITRYTQFSYAQEGEDLILLEYFADQINERGGGIYIDIGAHHPFRFSNTYKLYQKGWHGINIDAMPKSMDLFRQYRKRDINLEVGVGKKSGELDFYIFAESALNTFDAKLANKRHKSHPIKSVQKVPIKTFQEIIQQYLPNTTQIDLLSIDVEGLDYEILDSIQWKNFSPRVVLVESYHKDIAHDPIYIFMISKNYEMFAKTSRTYIFAKK